MKRFASLLLMALLSISSCTQGSDSKEPADYVNPYIGNISHLLVPTFPTVHLPNSMMRIYPVREDYTTAHLAGLPLLVPDHRKGAVLNFIPYRGSDGNLLKRVELSYDNEVITPYNYEVTLDGISTDVSFAPSHQSAIYKLDFDTKESTKLIFPNNKGEFTAKGDAVYGYEKLSDGKSNVYIYVEFDKAAKSVSLMKDGTIHSGVSTTDARSSLVVDFGKDNSSLAIRYGVSFISVEQAKKNLDREIKDYNVEALAATAKSIWNEALGRIDVKGECEEDMIIFYTALYRTFERPVVISEDGQYYSAFDGKVHSDNGRPFMVDDWLWDTYRATHPLRILIDKDKEGDIINSYVTMASLKEPERGWLPTFPKITGDSHGMNCNHGIISVWDAWNKGIRSFDLEKAYAACEMSIENKTLIPWSDAQGGVLDKFYKEHGYFPALHPHQEETVPHVGPFECRQAVAVTLGTSYDQWALSRIANALGKEDRADYYAGRGLDYRNVFNPETRFFHPKDEQGEFIPNVDYRYDRGTGARHYYDENNAYTYRWAVQQNIPDLIDMIGGNETFCMALDSLFNTSLGLSKFNFYRRFGGDQTGNVGQFSMGNEPSFHIPYLYNYAGEPWKTQKWVRNLLKTWFRNDVMGVPGDEDGGGMSAFVVFSKLGFYPVTPGVSIYSITGPTFEYSKMRLSSGAYVEIKAPGVSYKNKYIQSLKINGKEWNKTWFDHSDIDNGAVLEFVMGDKPNKSWGVDSVPPSGYADIK